MAWIGKVILVPRGTVRPSENVNDLSTTSREQPAALF
jgi:hypothetical protein